MKTGKSGFVIFTMIAVFLVSIAEEQKAQAQAKAEAFERSKAAQLEEMQKSAARAAQDGFAQIPPGEFLMGAENGEGDEKPLRKVRITRWFELGKYEVTQAQWQAVMGANPSHFKNCGGNCPVESVSWDDVQGFIARLNARQDGYTYRLPTEAEWEYACRAGTTGDYAGNLYDMAWFDQNSAKTPHAVGQKSPNAWGLYDMHGNVWEWCQDWSGAYASSEVEDPRGASSGSRRVTRGGSWHAPAARLRSAYRGGDSPSLRGYVRGFRLVRTPVRDDK